MCGRRHRQHVYVWTNAIVVSGGASLSIIERHIVDNRVVLHFVVDTTLACFRFVDSDQHNIQQMRLFSNSSSDAGSQDTMSIAGIAEQTGIGESLSHWNPIMLELWPVYNQSPGGSDNRKGTSAAPLSQHGQQPRDDDGDGGRCGCRTAAQI